MRGEARLPKRVARAIGVRKMGVKGLGGGDGFPMGDLARDLREGVEVTMDVGVVFGVLAVHEEDDCATE